MTTAGDGSGAIVNRRWGYVILLSRFVLVFLDAGIAKSFGVLLPEMQVRFLESYAILGLVCSLPATLNYVACPIVSVILPHTNHRVVAVSGGLLSGVSLTACAFITNIGLFGVCMALTGIGLAMTFMPLALMLNEYFPERFVFFNTIALYGYSAGTAAVPIIAEWSLQAYGYQGAYLILGGLALNTVVCGYTTIKPRRKPTGQVGVVSYRGASGESVVGERAPDVVELPNGICQDHTSGMSTVIAVEVHNSTHDDVRPDDLRPGQFPRIREGCEKEELASVARHVHNKDDNNTPLLQPDTRSHTIKAAGEEDGESVSLLDRISRGCQESFFVKERLFVFSITTFLLIGYCLYSWMLFLVPHARQLGIDATDAVFLSTLAGSGGLVGRTFFLVLISCKVDPFVIYIAVTVGCTGSFFLDAAGSGYAFRACLAFAQGFFFFIEDVIGLTLAKDVVKEERNFRSAFALGSFMIGAGAATAGLLTGFLYDVSHSFTNVFIIIGGIHAPVVVILVITWIIIKREKPKETILEGG